MKAVKHFSIVKGQFLTDPEPHCSTQLTSDAVVVEEPLQIWLQTLQQPTAELLFTTMRTPGNDIALVTGWLYSSGNITTPADILAISHTGTGRLKQQPTNQVLVRLRVAMDVQAHHRQEVMSSACGLCGQQSIEHILAKLAERQPSASLTDSLDPYELSRLAKTIVQHQALFNQTGGNHGVALFDKDMVILDVQEDVGRHNALDKLVGANIDKIHQQNAELCGLVLSGRVGFELVQKAAMANIQLIVALGAPSSLAIDLAKECDMILLGFVKSRGFNCYTGFDKLTVDQS